MRLSVVVVILLMAIGVGWGIGTILVDDASVEPITSGEEFVSKENQQPYAVEYGSGWIISRDVEKLYAFNRPNLSGWADYEGVYPFYVETNREGLRNDPIQIEKPEDTVRVLMVGTSTTFGYGVNRSGTFSKAVEERLNKEFEEVDVQVLNAGSPGYGMKDFYNYLKYRGIGYNPDIVVIAFTEITWRSREDSDRWNQMARQRLKNRSDYSNLTQKEQRELFQDYIGEMVQEEIEEGIENTDITYIDRIEELLESENIPVIYYSIDPLSYSGQKEYLERWAGNQSTEIHYPPKELWKGGVKYDNSELDSHPNSEGHKLIANGLSPLLETRIDQMIETRVEKNSNE